MMAAASDAEIFPCVSASGKAGFALFSLSSECEVRRAGLSCRVENPQTAAVAALERANNFSGAVDMNKWAAMEGFTDSDEEGNIPVLLRQGASAANIPSIAYCNVSLRGIGALPPHKLLQLTDSRPHQTRLQTKPLEAWHICKGASVSALSWNLQQTALWTVADVTNMPDACYRSTRRPTTSPTAAAL